MLLPVWSGSEPGAKLPCVARMVSLSAYPPTSVGAVKSASRAWIKRELNGRCFAAITTVVAHVTSFGGLYADWGKANTILLPTALWPAVETGASPRWVSWRQDRPLSHLATIWQQDWQYQPNAAVMYVGKGGIVTALKRLALSVAPTCFQYHGIGRRTGLKIRSSQEGVGSSPTFGISDSR
jgi:hypothetical protein